MKIINKTLVVAMVGLVLSGGASAQDGKSLFKANCASCHSIKSKRLVGPGLADTKGKRDEAWLMSWIKDPMAMVNSGDADAVAVYEEFNKMPMPGFAHLGDADIQAIIGYLPAAKAASEEEAAGEEEAEAPIVYTAEDIENGRKLFDGTKGLVNGGVTCISCHNVNNDQLGAAGGLLAKDLTEVYDRLGHAGIGGLLSAPPFPAMASSYGSKPLTEEEIFQLSAFFKEANDVKATQAEDDGYSIMLTGGAIGLVIWLVIIFGMYSKRKKESVKKDIFDRQKGNKSSDGVDS